MTQQTVLIVGGRIETVRKAHELGLRVIYLQHPHRFTPEHAPFVYAALLADFTDWAAAGPLIAGAHEAFGIDGVATLTEPGLETAGRANDLLGPSGVRGCGYEVNRLLRDKVAMRARQAAARLPGAVAAEPAHSPEILAKFGEAHGYPFVVKPAEGVASMGILRVDGPHQLDLAWRHVERVRAEPLEAPAFGSFPVHDFIVEEYLDGDEVSVETFTFDGRHVVLSVTEKTTLPNFLEVGHALPARLDDDTLDEVAAVTHAFLEMAGVRQGPAHTELRITSSGPRIVESHTRPGGDRILEMVDAAYGVDQERYTVGWPCRAVPELREPPPARCAAATRFITAEPGTVQHVEGVDRVRAEPDVLLVDVAVGVGDTVRPLAWSWDRPGQIIVTAPTTEAAVERCDALAREITIVTG